MQSSQRFAAKHAAFSPIPVDAYRRLPAKFFEIKQSSKFSVNILRFSAPPPQKSESSPHPLTQNSP
jgi:hypothetical protein